MTHHERFVAYLQARGEVRTNAEATEFVIARLNGWAPTNPLSLRVSPVDLDEHLDALVPHAAGAFCDLDDDREAAFRLFLMHLDEAVQTAATEDTKLYLDPPSGVGSAPS